jgi:hypothetical protein
MKTLRLILLLSLGLAAAASAQTRSRVTATNAVTVVPIHGDTITIFGSLRSFVTNITTNATQIRVTNGISATATNIYNHFLTYPVSGVDLFISQPVTNIVTFQAPYGTNLTASVNSNWATITYSTNTIGTSFPVIVGATNIPAATRTNTMNALIGELNTFTTPGVALSISLSNNTLLGTLNASNSLILGAKFSLMRSTNGIYIGGAATGLTNTGGVFIGGSSTNLTNHLSLLTSAMITGSTNINGVFTGGAFTGSTNTGGTFIGGEATGLTNINGVFTGGTFTGTTSTLSLVTLSLVTQSTNAGGLLVGTGGTNLVRFSWTNTTEALATVTNLSATLAALNSGIGSSLTNLSLVTLQNMLTNGLALTNGAALLGLNSSNVIGNYLLIANNNLADITNAAMARTNIGLSGVSFALASNVIDFAVSPKFHRTHSSNLNYTLQNTTARDFTTLMMTNAGVSIQIIGAALDNTIPTNGIVSVTLARFGTNVYGSVNTNWPVSASFE